MTSMRVERLVLIDNDVPVAVHDPLDVPPAANPSIDEPEEAAPSPGRTVEIITLDELPFPAASPNLRAGPTALLVMTFERQFGVHEAFVRALQRSAPGTRLTVRNREVGMLVELMPVATPDHRGTSGHRESMDPA
jgi:hypothetical protein